MLNENSTQNGSELALNTEKYFTIGKIAEAVSQRIGKRCTVAMINNYESQGLIPSPKRSTGGFRLYAPEIIGRVALIKRLQEEKLSLEEIKFRLDEGLVALDDDDKTTELPFDRREQILKAAAIVFPQKGYLETTMQDIAQETGISTSAIYQYFNGKEELFLALTESLSFMDVLKEITSSLEHKEDIQLEDIRQALIDVGNAYLNVHSANAEVVRLLFAETRRFPEIGSNYCERMIGPLETKFEKYLNFLIQQGIFRDVDSKNSTFAFFGMFLAFFLTIDILNGGGKLSHPTGESLGNLVDLFLHGILSN